MEDADTTDTSPESGKIVTRPGTAFRTLRCYTACAGRGMSEGVRFKIGQVVPNRGAEGSPDS